MCVAGAAYDFGQAANWATIVDVGGRYAGIATGLINLGNIGNVIQPWLGDLAVQPLRLEHAARRPGRGFRVGRDDVAVHRPAADVLRGGRFAEASLTDAHFRLAPGPGLERPGMEPRPDVAGRGDPPA